MAMSLEELLTVLAVTGILTLLIMDAWRMMHEVGGRVMKGTAAGVEVFDSLARSSCFIQEELDRERLDSLMIIQNNHEETNERLPEE